jgi:hypothetical protein
MKRTLIITQHPADPADSNLQALAAILGPSQIQSIEQFEPFSDQIERVIFYLQQPESASAIRTLISEHGALFHSLPLACVSLGPHPDLMPQQPDIAYLSLSHDMDEPACSLSLINFSLDIRNTPRIIDSSDVPDNVKTEIENFLSKHNTCSLTTTHESQITSRIIEYHYANDELHMISEGGEKFAGLLTNHFALVSIYEPFKSFADLAGMSLTGVASIPPIGSPEYIRSIGVSGLTMERIQRLPVAMNAIIIRPVKVVFLYAAFAKMGLAHRQTYYFS